MLVSFLEYKSFRFKGEDMTSRISMQVDFEGRKLYSTPISIEIDLKEYVKRGDREDFEIKIVDEATGKQYHVNSPHRRMKA